MQKGGDLSLLIEFIEVLGAWHGGQEIGEVLNGAIVQPVIDELAPGSGPVGEAYLNLINEVGDPMNLFD